MKLRIKLRNMSDQEIDFINEFERTRQERSDIYEQHIKTVLEALKPLVAHNLHYLKYVKIKFKEHYPFTEEQEEPEARHNALITILGRVIQWSISEGRELAYKILEETNDHRTAAKVKHILFFKKYLESQRD